MEPKRLRLRVWWLGDRVKTWQVYKSGVMITFRRHIAPHATVAHYKPARTIKRKGAGNG